MSRDPRPRGRRGGGPASRRDDRRRLADESDDEVDFMGEIGQPRPERSPTERQAQSRVNNLLAECERLKLERQQLVDSASAQRTSLAHLQLQVRHEEERLNNVKTAATHEESKEQDFQTFATNFGAKLRTSSIAKLEGYAGQLGPADVMALTAELMATKDPLGSADIGSVAPNLLATAKWLKRKVVIMKKNENAITQIRHLTDVVAEQQKELSRLRESEAALDRAIDRAQQKHKNRSELLAKAEADLKWIESAQDEVAKKMDDIRVGLLPSEKSSFIMVPLPDSPPDGIDLTPLMSRMSLEEDGYRMAFPGGGEAIVRRLNHHFVSISTAAGVPPVDKTWSEHRDEAVWLEESCQRAVAKGATGRKILKPELEFRTQAVQVTLPLVPFQGHDVEVQTEPEVRPSTPIKSGGGTQEEKAGSMASSRDGSSNPQPAKRRRVTGVDKAIGDGDRPKSVEEREDLDLEIHYHGSNYSDHGSDRTSKAGLELSDDEDSNGRASRLVIVEHEENGENFDPPSPEEGEVEGADLEELINGLEDVDVEDLIWADKTKWMPLYPFLDGLTYRPPSAAHIQLAKSPPGNSLWMDAIYNELITLEGYDISYSTGLQGSFLPIQQVVRGLRPASERHPAPTRRTALILVDGIGQKIMMADPDRCILAKFEKGEWVDDPIDGIDVGHVFRGPEGSAAKEWTIYYACLRGLCLVAGPQPAVLTKSNLFEKVVAAFGLLEGHTFDVVEVACGFGDAEYILQEERRLQEVEPHRPTALRIMDFTSEFVNWGIADLAQVTGARAAIYSGVGFISRRPKSPSDQFTPVWMASIADILYQLQRGAEYLQRMQFDDDAGGKRIFEGALVHQLPNFHHRALGPKRRVRASSLLMLARELYRVLAKGMNAVASFNFTQSGVAMWPDIGCVGELLQITMDGFHGGAIPPTEPHQHRGSRCELNCDTPLHWDTPVGYIRGSSRHNADAYRLHTWGEEFLALPQ